MHLGVLAQRYGDKTAVTMAGGPSLSYRALDVESNRIAHLLRRIGLRPGDHIAILLENRVEYFPIIWGAQRSGLYFTPVNWHLTEDEAAYIVRNCGARVLFSSAALEHVASRCVHDSSTLEWHFTVDAVSSSEATSLWEATESLPAEPIPDEVEGGYMFYSSGTTGKPKGVKPQGAVGERFGTGNPLDHLLPSGFGISEESVYLSPGPLYHASPMGWSMGTIRNGGTVVVMERFDAELALELVQRHRVTHAQFVPTMFVRMLKLSQQRRLGFDISSLRNVIHAAAPCPVAVKEQMIDWMGPIITEFYAGSEGAGFCMIDSSQWLTHKGSVGRPVRGAAHVCDDHGIELPIGQVGTIWFSGGGDFEYYREPEKTREAHNDRGWTTLGDMGYLDEDEYLYLVDRRTDLIISGGVNIYPREVEDVLTLHPAVADVAVIGIPDGDMGERVHAVVEPATQMGEDLADELMAYCRARMAHYKAPRTLDFDTALPRVPSGKILRRELAARYRPELGAINE